MSMPETAPLTMREALDLHFQRSGFDAASYTAPTFTLKLLGIPFTFPSTAGRRRALPLHDFHHILTGYGTDWVGEATIRIISVRRALAVSDDFMKKTKPIANAARRAARALRIVIWMSI